MCERSQSIRKVRGKDVRPRWPTTVVEQFRYGRDAELFQLGKPKIKPNPIIVALDGFDQFP